MNVESPSSNTNIKMTTKTTSSPLHRKASLTQSSFRNNNTATNAKQKCNPSIDYGGSPKRTTAKRYISSTKLKLHATPSLSPAAAIVRRSRRRKVLYITAAIVIVGLTVLPFGLLYTFLRSNVVSTTTTAPLVNPPTPSSKKQQQRQQQQQSKPSEKATEKVESAVVATKEKENVVIKPRNDKPKKRTLIVEKPKHIAANKQQLVKKLLNTKRTVDVLTTTQQQQHETHTTTSHKQNNNKSDDDKRHTNAAKTEPETIHSIDVTTDTIVVSSTDSRSEVSPPPPVPVLVAANNSVQQKSKFAYAYVVGGCNVDTPAYRPFLYNIMMNTNRQRDTGSTADVIVLIQLSHDTDTTTTTTLPESDVALLTKMNIHIQYIPKASSADEDTFDALMMEKYRIFSLTQYDRILYADSDVLFLESMDYLFDMSIAGDIAPYVVFAGRRTPVRGELFLCTPGRYDRVVTILEETKRRGEALPFPHWDSDIGWGHRFQHGDQYEMLNGMHGRGWDFAGAYSDLGFLYNWVRYETMNHDGYTIVTKDTLKTWALSEDGIVQQQSQIDMSDMAKYANNTVCWQQYHGKHCVPPLSSHVHFVGGQKPWLHPPPKQFTGTYALESAVHYWYNQMSILNTQLDLGIDIMNNWDTNQRPLLGVFSNHLDSYTDAIQKSKAEKESSPAKYAYAYVVSGCDPQTPTYIGFLYTIMINTRIQKSEGSTADVVLFVQMAYASTSDVLPGQEVANLQQYGIKIIYIPKAEDESLYRTVVFDKFRILGLTQYRRVMYLDADVVVRGSMDYMFELSDNGTLMENVVITGRVEPAIGTLFIVTPHVGDWEIFIELMRAKEEQGEWDETIGWGQEIKTPYKFINTKSQTGWGFTGASSDQGILYYWINYVQKSASLIFKHKIENWAERKDNGVYRRQNTLNIEVFIEYGAETRTFCWEKSLAHKPCVPPHSDWVHFPSVSKPWINDPPEDYFQKDKDMSMVSPNHFWFSELDAMNRDLKLGLDLKQWTKHQRPAHGVKLHESEVSGTSYAEGAVDLSVPINSPYTVPWDNTKKRRFAVVYVIGGVAPTNPSYRNYFNDIFISAYKMREEGSQADVVILVQIAYASQDERLPPEDMRLMTAMGIKIKYIPKAEDESFYRTMMDKFQALKMTEYERIIFSDGDVMMQGSMDYLFEQSASGVLKENVVFAGQTEPANGGLFLMTPKEGSWERLLAIVAEKEKRCIALPYPHWDLEVGWGHKFLGFEAGDYHENLGGRIASTWNFYGAVADQGLLYHWVKYEEKSMSIVFREEIQNWGAVPDDPDGRIRLEKTMSIDLFKDRPQRVCWKEVMKFKPCRAPHSDFVHYTAKAKPWLRGPPEDFGEVPHHTTMFHVWFGVLHILDEKLHMGLDFDNWRTHHKPYLGTYSKNTDVAKTSYADLLLTSNNNSSISSGIGMAVATD